MANDFSVFYNKKSNFMPQMKQSSGIIILLIWPWALSRNQIWSQST